MKPFHLALFAPLLANPAFGDACREEIAALFDGGAMDPFARPPHVQTVKEYNAEGVLQRENFNYSETPMRTIAGSGGHYTMAIDTKVWTGPSPEGPWTDTGQSLPEDRDQTMVTFTKQTQANLVDTVCHGTDAEGYLHYTYRSKTDPDENGMFFGALSEIWVNPKTGHVEKMQMSEFVNSWSDGVSDNQQTLEFDYSQTVKVDPPG